MRSAVKVETLDVSDKVYPGAVQSPDGFRTRRPSEKINPVYVVVIWTAQTAGWSVVAKSVSNEYHKAFRSHCDAGRSTDLGYMLAAAIVCITDVSLYGDTPAVGGVVLDVVTPAGTKLSMFPAGWPGSRRKLFEEISAALPLAGADTLAVRSVD